VIESLKLTLKGLFEAGSLWALPVVYVIGVLSAFLPCIYPVIPLTLSVIGAAGAGSKLRGFVVSLAYVIGITVTYTTLATVLILGGRLSGTVIASSVWPKLLVGAVFILLALWMLDVFTLKMPGSSLAKVQSKLPKGRILGVFGAGLIAGLLVSSCTGPVLATVLMTTASRKQSIALSIATVVAYSLGTGTLFIVFGTFYGAISRMPKPGPWMEKLKKVMALLIIGLGAWFIFSAGMTYEANREGPGLAPPPVGEAARTQPARPSAGASDVPVGFGVGERIPALKLTGYALPGVKVDPLIRKTGEKDGVTYIAADLSQVVGKKPFALVFWASSCGQCVAEIPHVNALVESLGPRAVVLGVSFYVDNLKKSYNTARKHGVRYPIVLDTNRAASEPLKVDIVPIVLLVDKTGVIRYRDDSVPSNARELLGL